MIEYRDNSKEEKKEKRMRKIKLILFFLLFLGIVVGAFFFFRSDFLRIKNINITGVEGEVLVVAKDVFLKKLNNNNFFVEYIFRDDNFLIFLFREGEISESMKKEAPLFYSVDFEISLFARSVDISIVEREKFGLWCGAKTESEKCGWFDKNNVVFLPGFETEGGLLRKVVDYSKEDVKIGESVLDDEYFSNVLKIFDLFEKENIGINKLVIRDISLKEIESESINYPKFFFSLREDPFFAQKAINKLKDSFKKIEYIDLRVENRVYYK